MNEAQHVKDQPVASMACTAGSMEAEGLITVRISPAGVVESKRGTYLLDSDAARLCIEAFTEHGVELPIDFEHQSLAGEYSAPDGRAPAAGWVESLHFDPNKGLMGQVKWNPKGRDAIRANEYRYLSPVFSVRQSDRRAVALHSAGLTNLPAIPRMDRLAASTRVDDAGDAIVAHDDAPTKNVAAPLGLMQKLRDALGLGKEASAGAVLEAALARLVKGEGESTDSEVASSVRQRLGLADDAGKDEVILAMTTRLDDDARSEIVAMKQAERERVAQEHVHRYCLSGHLNPNDTAQIACATRLALEEPARLDALFANAPPAIPPGRTTAPPRAIVERDKIIANAAREFKDDVVHGKLTSLRAFIDLRLREAGQSKLSDSEAAECGCETVVA